MTHPVQLRTQIIHLFWRRDVMKKFNTTLSSLMLAISAIFCAHAEAGGTVSQIITFDVPGSACQPAFYYCTQAFAINASGAVVGWYADSTQAMHGFLRQADGSFVGIDPPGATCGGVFTACSRPAGINDAGAITGFYDDADGSHAYIRAPDGGYTTFDFPGAFCCTGPSAISSDGTVIGSYVDPNFLGLGFIRTKDGKFATVDVPAGVNGTYPSAINPEGTIIGTYYDENNNGHSFVRYQDGDAVEIEVPRSQGTGVTAINPAGDIVGYYEDLNLINHGFIRRPSGFFISFDAASPPFVTQPVGINPAGIIAGNCQRINQPCGGFVRAQNGSTTLFNPPNTILTAVSGINAAGVIAGWYDDVGYLQHAFIRFPWPLQAAVAGN
jgi:hypothetical protein